MTPAVTLAIGVVAVLYSAVGHAGATGYAAMMALAGLAPEVVRPTALVLNVVVAAIGTVQFARAGHFPRGLFLPLAAASVPCAAVGGGVQLPAAVFETLLGIVLLIAAARIVLEAVRGCAAPTADADRPPPGTVVFRHRVQVTDVVEVRSLGELDRFRDRHVWSDAVVAERFHRWRDQLHVLAVRVVPLPASVTLPWREDYGGCKSWVELAADVPVG